MTALAELVDAFLENEFETSPVLATGLGLTDYDDRLDDLSAESFRRRDADAADYLSRFEAIADDGFGLDDAVDRDLAISVLRGRVILADWEGWRRDPLVYSSPITNGLFLLFLHRLRPVGDLVDAAIARLGKIDASVDQGVANLDPSLANPLIVERGLGAARGAARYVRELLGADLEPGPDRDRLEAAGRDAAPALDRWVAHLEGLRDAASGPYVLGEERYTRLLREREALAFDTRGLRDAAQLEFDQLDVEMRMRARAIQGTDDYQAVLAAANEDHPPTEAAMRESYEDWTARARGFLAVSDLFTLPPGEHCAVVPSPIFQRPVLGVPFYIAPPAFTDSLAGHFFVPYAPDGTSPEDIQKRLAGNANGIIPTISVHEAYPGHHWHLVMRKSNPSRLRRVFSTPYFSEGWALYAERLMRERGFYTEPLHELYHLNSTIFRAARIIVDTSLHLGEMSYEDAVTFMVKHAALPEPTARAEVGRYCWWPTQASSYLTGCLEILRIRERYLRARGFDGPPANAPVGLLRDFHDGLASTGSLPLGVAARAILEPLEAASTS